MEVFFYVPKDKVDKVIECGLRLNEWSNRTININGVQKRYIAMLLNPKDDLVKYNDEKYIPLKIEVDPTEVLVADGALYRDEDKGASGSLYERSLVLLDKYIFGSFRLPECLMPATIPNRLISKMDKRIDVPVLYDRSEEIYLQYHLERCKDSFDDFIERLFHAYYESLVEKGLCVKHYTNEASIIVYESLLDGQVMTVRRGKPAGFKHN